MSITPARHNIDTAPIAGSSQVEEKTATAEPEAVKSIGGLESEGSMPHNQRVFGSATQWMASQQRALPAATMGMRAGSLVAPGGSLSSRSRLGALRGTGSSNKLKTNANKPMNRAQRAQRKSATAHDADDAEADETGGAAHSHGADELGVNSSMAFGDAMGSGDSRDHAAVVYDSSDMLQADVHDADQPAPARYASAASLASAARTGGPSSALTAAQVLASRLQAGQLCWAASLNLAMQCAQMHPGTDIFVQAFTLVDADGDVIPLLSKRARLRATAGGAVRAHAADGQREGDGESSAAHEQALMAELQAAPLLGLSLRPIVDESGQAASALGGARLAELHHLQRLFERPLPPALRAALWASTAQLAAQWQALCENPDFAERMARHGDALERALNEERTRLSETIHTPSANAYRARSNWLNAQAQVSEWARRGRRPDFDGLQRVNELLGEGLKPWNRPEQADRAGARFGVLRHFDVVSGVPPRHYLRAEQLLQATIDLFEWYAEQRERMPAPIIAAQCFQRLVSLHPFADANGRTARLIADWTLLLAGLPPALLEGANMALFPNEAEGDNLPAGQAEREVVAGLVRTLGLHADWLQLDDPV